MENQGLIFIPDISGFTKFVNETEINHSRLILEELLEVLISQNSIGLEISEIEGDAILFYKWGAAPAFEELYEQVVKMFCAFHESLTAYDYRKYCQCKACTSAANLTLKIITQYGEFTAYKVRNFSKLIGKDLIIAHQLLKNEIERHEYWLVTENIASSVPDKILSDNITWESSVKGTESGIITFKYTPLSFLRERISKSPAIELPLIGKKKVLSFTREYAVDIITLFHATGDFNIRQHWKDGIKKIEEVTHYLPRVGMKCRCITEEGESFLTSSSYTYSDEHIMFSETDQNNHVTQYNLRTVTPLATRLTVDYFVPKGFLTILRFYASKKDKTEREFIKSLSNLDQLMKTFRI